MIRCNIKTTFKKFFKGKEFCFYILMFGFFLQKRNQRWRPAQRTYGAVLPEAVANDLLNREFTESDYELLTQLDR